MVAPYSEEYGRKMVVGVACHFPNECCNLFLDVGYIKNIPPYCLSCDALIFHLSHADA